MFSAAIKRAPQLEPLPSEALHQFITATPVHQLPPPVVPGIPLPAAVPVAPVMSVPATPAVLVPPIFSPLPAPRPADVTTSAATSTKTVYSGSSNSALASVGALQQSMTAVTQKLDRLLASGGSHQAPASVGGYLQQSSVDTRALSPLRGARHQSASTVNHSAHHQSSSSVVSVQRQQQHDEHHHHHHHYAGTAGPPIEPSTFDPRASAVLDDAMAQHFAALRLRNALQDVRDAEFSARAVLQSEQTARANTLAFMQGELNAAIAEDLRLLRLRALEAEELLRRHYERLAAGEERRRVDINAARTECEAMAAAVRRSASAMSDASASRSRFASSAGATLMTINASHTRAATTTVMHHNTTNINNSSSPFTSSGQSYPAQHWQAPRSSTAAMMVAEQPSGITLAGVSPLSAAAPRHSHRPVTATGVSSSFFSPNPAAAAGGSSSHYVSQSSSTKEALGASSHFRGGTDGSGHVHGDYYVPATIDPHAGVGRLPHHQDMSLLHAAQLPEQAAQQSRRKFKAALMNEALSGPVV